jgi:FAD synthetase
VEKKSTVRVLASGVFDLVHYGHIHFLKEARKAGGDEAHLIVVVARDKTVTRLKGQSPILPEEQRRAIVESLKPVDEAILGGEDFDMGETLEKVKPDIVAVGYDQTDEEVAVRKVIAQKGLSIKVVHVGRFVASGLESSSGIKRKIVSRE